MIKSTFRRTPMARAIGSVMAIPRQANDTVAGEMALLAEDMEGFAKAAAPWTDRTGDARDTLEGYSGVYGTADQGPGVVNHFVGVKHGVEYGKWLEVRWGGRWGIVQRTLEIFIPQIRDRISRALNGAGIGGA